MNKVTKEDLYKRLYNKVPTTVKDAEEIVQQSATLMNNVHMNAVSNAFLNILINKGIITAEEWKEYFNQSKKQALEDTAKMLMQNFDEFDKTLSE